MKFIAIVTFLVTFFKIHSFFFLHKNPFFISVNTVCLNKLNVKCLSILQSSKHFFKAFSYVIIIIPYIRTFTCVYELIII